MARSLEWSRGRDTWNLSSDSMLRSRRGRRTARRAIAPERVTRTGLSNAGFNWARYPHRTVESGLRGGLFADPVERAHHSGALVLDVVQARRLGDPPGLSGADVELQPQGTGADRDSLPCDLRRVLGRPEDVDEVDLHRHVFKRAIDTLAEQLIGERVDRNDAEPTLLQPNRNRAPGLVGIARSADHGDRGRRII